MHHRGIEMIIIKRTFVSVCDDDIVCFIELITSSLELMNTFVKIISKMKWFSISSRNNLNTHTHTRQEGRGFFSHIHNNFEARTSVSKKINAVLVALINIYFDSIFFKIFDLLDSIRYFFFCFRGVNSYLMTSSIK